MYLLIKFLSFVFCTLPVSVSLYIGRILGRIYFFLDRKHRQAAYHNLRLSLAQEFTPGQLRQILKQHYLAMAQNLVEVLYMPRIDAAYLKRYVQIQGAEYLKEADKKNKGMILTTAHFGNWEIPSIVCKYLFPKRAYVVLIKDQSRIKKLNELLNSYRKMHGYSLVSHTPEGLRQALTRLKEGCLLGMVIDQGMGSSGVYIDFFNHRVGAPSGAVKLALEFNIPLFLTYTRRIKGPYLSTTILPALNLKRDDLEKAAAIQAGVQELNKKMQEVIRQFPADYLWQFKRFKHRLDRKILIIADAKAGHLRQSEAVAKILSGLLEHRGFGVNLETINVEFNSKFQKVVLGNFLRFFGCPAAFWYLGKILPKGVYLKLLSACPDFIISAGSGPAIVNALIARENKAKSITLMKPSPGLFKNFDLVIVPRHDRVNALSNVLILDGAPNLIDQAYLNSNARFVADRYPVSEDPECLKIGFLIGGDTKDFQLSKSLVEKTCDEIISLAINLNAQIIVSTSRRTSSDIEQILKNKFQGLSHCPLLIIANEKNIPQAVGAILGLCQLVIVSAESISMVSEAASSGKYIIAFGLPGKDKESKRERFLNSLEQQGVVYRAGDSVAEIGRRLWLTQPQLKRLDNAPLIREALEKII